MVKKINATIILAAIACLFGCAGQNTAAGNVATGATINAVAGVPGAGIVGLVATAADIISQSGHPEVGKMSPEFSKHFLQAPACISYRKDGKNVMHWKSRKKEDGSLITKDNAPKRSMEYAETFILSAGQFCDGIFGDTPEMQAKNLAAWKEGKTVVAEFHGPNNANIAFVSVNREPAEVMLSEEWAARNAGVTADSGDTKEPVNGKN